MRFKQGDAVEWNGETCTVEAGGVDDFDNEFYRLRREDGTEINGIIGSEMSYATEVHEFERGEIAEMFSARQEDIGEVEVGKKVG